MKTFICSFSSNEEAGRYLETYKVFENKPADILQERVDGDYQSKVCSLYVFAMPKVPQ